MPDEQFDQLMKRLRDGDPSAAGEIYARFASRLAARAARHLGPRIRQKVDPEDVALSAFKSFFIRFADGQFEVSGWGSLWGLLTKIALRKCGYQTRYYRTAGRNVHRETTQAAKDESVASHLAIAREPSPLEDAMLAEALEHLLADLKPLDRKIVELTLLGLDLKAVSEETGYSERTVRRKLDRVREQLLGLAREPDEPA